MKNLNSYRVLLWDFDGVIMDSMPVRELGFKKVLAEYPEDQVQELLLYHRRNGGWSRYVKFRYFFEQIRNEEVTEEAVQRLSQSFSEIMKKLLLSHELLIQDSLWYIRSQSSIRPMHVVSGSDGIELRYLCEQHGLTAHFLSIQGSPTPKELLIKNLLESYSYSKDEVLMIGDAVNDRDAAAANGIDFAGYNNEELRNKRQLYVHSFSKSTLVRE